MYTALGHEWYPRDCCSGRDCKPISCKELIENNFGNVEYQDYTFKGQQIRKSLDEHCHVCIQGKTPRCVFRIIPNS